MDPQRFSVFVPFGKVAEQGDGTILVETVVNDELPDDQGEIVTYEAVEKASGPFMEWANVRAMHQADHAAGTVAELRKDSEAKTHTAVVHVVDPVDVKKVQTGVYKGTSLGGFKTDFGPMRKVADKQYRTVTAIDWRELSLVDRPSRPSARLTLLKISDAEAASEPEELEKKDFTQKQRDAAAAKGNALPDGSFPINNKADLSNAVSDYGRASDKAAAKKHITKRAKALGATDLLPADWPGSTKSEKASQADPIEGGQMDPENELAEAGSEGSSEPAPETHPSTEDAPPQGTPAEPAPEQPTEAAAEEEPPAEPAEEAEPTEAEPTEKASQSKPLAKSAADDIDSAQYAISLIARLIEREGEEGDTGDVTLLKAALASMQEFASSEAEELGTPEDVAEAEAEKPVEVVVVGGAPMFYASVIGDLAKQALSLKKGSTLDAEALQRNQALHDMAHNAGAACEIPPAPELAKVASAVDTDAFVEGLASRLVDRFGAVASKADMDAVRGEFVGALKPLQDTLAKIAAQPAPGGPLRYAVDSRGFLTDPTGQPGNAEVAEALSKASLAPGISPQTKEDLGRLAAQELYKAQLAGRAGGAQE